jgi:hypothetical protein
MSDQQAKNTRVCKCCGTRAPYPTEPGEWEYSHPAYPDIPWQRVKIVHDGEGLTVIPRKKRKPIWWPSDAAWRPYVEPVNQGRKICDGCKRPLDEHLDNGRRCEACRRRIAEVFDAD